MKDKPLHNRLRWVVVFAFMLLVTGLIAFAGWVQPAAAAPLLAPVAQKPDNSACLACHGQPGQTWTLPSGEAIGISVDSAAYDMSVHQNFNCSTCHVNISGYPHPQNTAQTIQEFRQQFKNTCNNCHQAQAADLKDSAHTMLAAKGNPNTPICIDCHNAHTQVTVQLNADGKPTYEEDATIAKICAKCHNGIYQQYINSVHGAGVLAQNPDVPACNDCHGIHTITDARSVQFRLDSPTLCASCHTNASIMDKYGISTNVLSTYVADFHGTTVTLFEKLSPDQQTNKPVCYDCHGVHNISRVDDPKNGLELKQNMLAVCQKCHPDATINFPDSWLSHYIPSPEKYPLVYYVNLFYMILIPGVLIGMAAIIATDIFKRIRSRGKPDHSTGKEA
jgi:predicted CXXCH cytochrome family protein